VGKSSTSNAQKTTEKAVMVFSIMVRRKEGMELGEHFEKLRFWMLIYQRDKMIQMILIIDLMILMNNWKMSKLISFYHQKTL
jgi:hypothetical protein